VIAATAVDSMLEEPELLVVLIYSAQVTAQDAPGQWVVDALARSGNLGPITKKSLHLPALRNRSMRLARALRNEQ